MDSLLPSEARQCPCCGYQRKDVYSYQGPKGPELICPTCRPGGPARIGEGFQLPAFPAPSPERVHFLKVVTQMENEGILPVFSPVPGASRQPLGQATQTVVDNLVRLHAAATGLPVATCRHATQQQCRSRVADMKSALDSAELDASPNAGSGGHRRGWLVGTAAYRHRWMVVLPAALLVVTNAWSRDAQLPQRALWSVGHLAASAQGALLAGWNGESLPQPTQQLLQHNFEGRRGARLDWRCLVPNGRFDKSAGGTFPYPKQCLSTIASYLKDGSYDRDVHDAIFEARVAFNFTFRKDLPINSNHSSLKGLGKRRANSGMVDPEQRYAVVFDIDETALCNIKSRQNNWEVLAGATEAVDAVRGVWQNSADTPPIVPTLRLYRELYKRGYHPTFITGRSESSRQSTEANLLAAGYGRACSNNYGGHDRTRTDGTPCYIQLDLRGDQDRTTSATVYKGGRRRMLQDAGWTLVASFGDQFSDLSGDPVVEISVKLPNPVYYIL
mmetsp:Transcript_5419/g.15520  ORF Transcript_5419/g.15520 Transcript_5419/m.15520 type:complete len:500 (+) Transcript_5419:209-1708(+)|eukprot:CAMPEP_0206147008 /NCGR_PEP_ID=MMETSP1473-20131121/32129_1 /ASSEMBLY_ACC=CAM_ASM_001109 /TAXON_ID=1461547 /ORGANISM="Stichococcus sp, Strain RCC1054" /LENGTH=499 /DNA_ID=CAMNT_0053543775 /DNA_START=192 /DNA_END=1691 /DNA_ORIENTATION=-